MKSVENVEEISTLFNKDKAKYPFYPTHFLSFYSRTLCSPPNPQKAQLAQVG